VQCAWGKVGATLAKQDEDGEKVIYKTRQLNSGAASRSASRPPRALQVVQMTNKRALFAYKLNPYPGRVTLFRAKDPNDGYEFAVDNGWSALAKGGVEIHNIPGEHEEIFAQPNVRELAKKLDACIRAALAEEKSEAD
jgi:thioesterase domain-containing protein